MIGKYIKQIDKIFPKPSKQKRDVELLVSKVYEDAQNDLRNELFIQKTRPKLNKFYNWEVADG